MPSYAEYLGYIRFADIHPQVLHALLSKKFGISLETAKRAVKGMTGAGLIYAQGDIVILTDDGRALCDEFESSNNRVFV